MDVKAEHFERQVARVESERDAMEKKYEDMRALYEASKKELEEVSLGIFSSAFWLLDLDERERGGGGTLRRGGRSFTDGAMDFGGTGRASYGVDLRAFGVFACLGCESNSSLVGWGRGFYVRIIFCNEGRRRSDGIR